jgi:uncharacterized membrane protein YeaQ/YmgE (transglycosylase-associated protein family)
MDYLPIIISLITGAASGNLTGTIFKNLNLGTLANSLAGILGGGLGGRLLSILGVAAALSGGMDLDSLHLCRKLSERSTHSSLSWRRVS